MREVPQPDSRSDKPAKGFLIAVVVFALIGVAAALYITIGYETADDPGAATPAPERLEDSPVRPPDEPLEPPAPERDERTAPAVPPPGGDPIGTPDPTVPPGPES